MLTIQKEWVAMLLFSTGILLIYVGMLNPWFMWPLGRAYLLASAALLLCSLLISNTMEESLFTGRYITPPLVAYVVLSIYIALAGKSLMAIVGIVFRLVPIALLLTLRYDRLRWMINFIARCMGLLLAVSLGAFFLHLAGFAFPNAPAHFEDTNYYYTNYYFFMISDSAANMLLPRFSSVFLEPGHIGTAAVMLLMTQCGRWKKWYNIIFIATAVLSFSLEAYVLLFLLFFLNLWLQRRHVVAKFLGVIVLMATVVAGSFVYNDGDNTLNNLIILRLEVEDGDIAGNNRVTEQFDDDFNDLMHSTDVLFGRDFDYEYCSGYKVFIYENGLVGLVLLFVFYALLLARTNNRRALFVGFVIVFLDFIVRAHSLWFSVLVPFYFMACGFSDLNPAKQEKYNAQNFVALS